MRAFSRAAIVAAILAAGIPVAMAAETFPAKPVRLIVPFPAGVATDIVAKSPPDGYTLGVVITAHMINPTVRSNLPYDTVKDLSGVSMLAISHIVLVATNALAANNVTGLVDLAKKNPGGLSYAT